MEQSNVFGFDGFQIERESFLGSDCYVVVTSCKKDGAGIPYHLEVEFDISKARFSFSKCYAMRWSLVMNFLLVVSLR